MRSKSQASWTFWASLLHREELCTSPFSKESILNLAGRDAARPFPIENQLLASLLALNPPVLFVKIKYTEKEFFSLSFYFYILIVFMMAIITYYNPQMG